MGCSQVASSTILCNRRFYSYSLFLPLLVLASCTTGHCRRNGLKIDYTKSAYAVGGDELVKVSKVDGSKQCGLGAGIPAGTMAKELDGIKILKMTKEHDGLVRVQVCGAPVGMHNIYTIPLKFLKTAEGRGFKVYGDDPRSSKKLNNSVKKLIK